MCAMCVVCDVYKAQLLTAHLPLLWYSPGFRFKQREIKLVIFTLLTTRANSVYVELLYPAHCALRTGCRVLLYFALKGKMFGYKSYSGDN